MQKSITGDLQAAKGNRKAAGSAYDEVLDRLVAPDSEISEIRARAFFRRARNRDAMGQTKAAADDYGRAADLYKDLGEFMASAESDWERIMLQANIPDDLRRITQNERPTVRVAAVKLHLVRLENRKSLALSHRKKPSREYWEQLVRDAHVEAATEEREW